MLVPFGNVFFLFGYSDFGYILGFSSRSVFSGDT